MQEDIDGAIHIPRSILDEDLSGILRVADDVPGLGVFGIDVFGIVKDAGRSPHITHGVVVGIDTSVGNLRKHSPDIRGNIGIDIVGRVSEILVDRQEQAFVQHPLDDVIRRAYHVEILVALLNLREHRLVDVESLVHDLDRLAGLFFIPLLELGDEVLVDIVSPVVDLEEMLAVRAAGRQQAQRQQRRDVD